MEVILLERIEKLGQMGDVVRVKSGYARNFLIPQKKALRANEENRKYFETRRAQLEAANLERRQEAEAVASKVDGLIVTLIRQAGDAGQLYGSVSARDVADAVNEAGVGIDRQQVDLSPPIKTIGLHPVRVVLHPEVNVTVRVNVARTADEAELQAKTGEAVIAHDEGPQAEPEAIPAEELMETPPAEAVPEAEEPAETAEEPAETGSESDEEADKA